MTSLFSHNSCVPNSFSQICLEVPYSYHRCLSYGSQSSLMVWVLKSPEQKFDKICYSSCVRDNFLQIWAGATIFASQMHLLKFSRPGTTHVVQPVWNVLLSPVCIILIFLWKKIHKKFHQNISLSQRVWFSRISVSQRVCFFQITLTKGPLLEINAVHTCQFCPPPLPDCDFSIGEKS